MHALFIICRLQNKTLRRRGRITATLLALVRDSKGNYLVEELAWLVNLFVASVGSMFLRFFTFHRRSPSLVDLANFAFIGPILRLPTERARAPCAKSALGGVRSVRAATVILSAALSSVVDVNMAVSSVARRDTNVR